MYTETTKLKVYGEPDNMEQIEIRAKETEKDEKHGLTLDQSTNRLDSASTFLLTLLFGILHYFVVVLMTQEF